MLIIDEISHRLLVTIGSGKKGFKDGTFATAQFDSPQVLLYSHVREVVTFTDENNTSFSYVTLTTTRSAALI